jgi:metal-sulfur cluster biosynthetic enzyme
VIWEQLRKCYDPEIPVNIAELGLIYEVSVKPSSPTTNVFIQMSLTAPGCGMGQVLMDDVKRKVEQIPKVNASVELTFDPPWTPERMSEEARLTTGLM